MHSGAYRFTLLTERLIRIEYSPAQTFEEHPSQVFWHREQPAPPFERTQNGAQLEIHTDNLTLRCQTDAPPTADTLSIYVNATAQTWRYGDADPANLGGTARTLDCANGPIPLEPGLISRSGWALVDDSASLIFNEQGWLQPRNAAPGTLDLYFFGYGHDYAAALCEYRRIAGLVPLIPRWALGNWWSRYWACSQAEFIQLMLDFENYDIPLSVCIIDMDWHITETGNAASGWTGYTWNRELFPNPPALLEFLHQKGLKTALNLHPADGVWPHEAAYPAVAQRMGVDPASGQPIPFDITDPHFVQVYLEELHHPLEAQGVDFWWLDWQQGSQSTIPGLDPLFLLNHLHFHDLARPSPSPAGRGARGEGKRPFIFSRWGGLGSHRYPIGFSGDSYVTWESLAFQPHFTASAANVGYGWWSHDIGGHYFGIEDAELYTRWVQFGVFSPILRLHSTKNDFQERRPWGYDAETLRVARRAFQLRHKLIPYIYSMAWRDHQHAQALVQPMYHSRPADEAAYHCPNQYAFGSELIAAPYTEPIHPETRLSRQTLWLPEGDWFDFFSGEHHAGGWQALYGALDEIPVFAKAGAIVPLAEDGHLNLLVFPGADNRFDVYDDDGHSQGYQNGEYSLTVLKNSWQEGILTFEIDPTEHVGRVPNRTLGLTVRGLAAPKAVILTLNGIQLKTWDTDNTDWTDLHRSNQKKYPRKSVKSASSAFYYDPEIRSLMLPPLELAPDDHLRLEVHATLERPDARQDKCIKLLRAFRLESMAKQAIAVQLPQIIENPALLAAFRTDLTDAHLRALLETITGAGVSRITSTGDEEFLLWNNAANPAMRYQLAVHQTHVWEIEKRFALEDESLPAFRAIHPPSEFGQNRWALRVNYHHLLSLEFGK